MAMRTLGCSTYRCCLAGGGHHPLICSSPFQPGVLKIQLRHHVYHIYYQWGVEGAISGGENFGWQPSMFPSQTRARAHTCQTVVRQVQHLERATSTSKFRWQGSR